MIVIRGRTKFVRKLRIQNTEVAGSRALAVALRSTALPFRRDG